MGYALRFPLPEKVRLPVVGGMFSLYPRPFFAGALRQPYQALFSLLQQQGYRNVYAVINLPNDREC